MGTNENQKASASELTDSRKIGANIWSMVTTTNKLSDLCEKLNDVLSIDEQNQLNSLKDERLKCFYLYSNFINGHHEVNHQSSLLKALRSTGNSTIADQILTTTTESIKLRTSQGNQGQENHKKVAIISKIEVNPHQILEARHKIPSVVSYEVQGNNKIYSSPASLRISKSFQNKITSLTLTNIQISLHTLKKAIQPCQSVNEIHMKNVIFNRDCERPSEDNDVLILPYIKKYVFHSDNENSKNYTWDNIFFFSMSENNKTSLLNLWKGQTVIDVHSQSMQISLNCEGGVDERDSQNSIFISLAKKEFYDAPNFVPFVERESIHVFLKNLTNVKSLTCLLPEKFGSIDFEDLPCNLHHLHLSGMKVNYSKKCDNFQKHYKPYKNVQFERCQISQMFLDDISVIFPLSEKVQLTKCHVEVDSDEGADISIFLK